jgi:hypothetical protein
MVLAALLEVALLVARADQGRLAIRRGQEAIDEMVSALLGSSIRQRGAVSGHT